MAQRLHVSPREALAEATQLIDLLTGYVGALVLEQIAQNLLARCQLGQRYIQPFD